MVRCATGCSIGRADPEPLARSGPADWKRCGLAALGFAALGAVLLHTQLAQMRSVPDLGDPLFSMWRMGWVFHQLGGDPRPLFDANIFHPEPLTLTYSDSMLLPALMGAPLLAAGLHPVVAYNVLFLSGFLLSALTTYVLIVALTGLGARGVRRRAALRLLSLSLRALQPPRAADDLLDAARAAGAAPLLPVVADPLRRSRWALCGVAQLYSSMYYGVFFPLYAAAILGTLLLVSRPGLAPGRCAAGGRCRDRRGAGHPAGSTLLCGAGGQGRA